jgi:CP family cyanate transporter-like MFS transporter
MPEHSGLVFTPRALFALGVAGVLILALSARTGVAALAPLAGDIDLDVSLDVFFLGLLGMIPPIAYGIAGWLTRGLVAKLSLESLAIIVGGIAALGHVFRGLAPSYVGLFIATAVLMLAVGVTNVLLPALVKLYAPGHIGPVTSVYSLLMAISTATPAIFGVWLADQAGWRWSLGSWAVVSAVAIIPWLIFLPQANARRSAERLALVGAPPAAQRVSLWGSVTARWLAVLFAVSGFTAYSMFAVLPAILIDTAGFSRDEAGFALFLWSMMGVPLSLVIPLLAVRPGWPERLAVLAAVMGVSGFSGLLLIPGTLTYLWVVLTGLATIGFALVLTLIGTRSENHHTAAQLSGLINTVGYFIAGAGPVVVGLLVQFTGQWWPALVLMIAVTSSSALAFPVLRRGATVDEEMRALSAHVSK